ncbi:hypothetical protein MRB53_041621 [Persea americana]|nr:hypothetical protein MRB53_041621 [Persea americana]
MNREEQEKSSKDSSKSTSPDKPVASATPVKVENQKPLSSPSRSAAKAPELTPKVNVRHEGTAMSVEDQQYFASWGTSESRAGPRASVRRAVIRGLPKEAVFSTVAELTFGGTLEEIVYKAGSTTAMVIFIDPDDCQTFYNGSRKLLDIPGFPGHKAAVELAQEAEPLSGMIKQYCDLEYTRCVRVIGIDANVMDRNSCIRAAVGNGRKQRNVEHVSFFKTKTGAQAGEFRFCSISEAVRFKGELQRSEDWESCNFIFMADPCDRKVA